MTEEEEGTALELAGQVQVSPENAAAYLEARHDIERILEEQCIGTLAAVNVMARVEAGILAAAMYGQPDSAKVEEALGIGLQAFRSYRTGVSSRHATRPR